MSTEYDRAETDSRTDDFVDDRVTTGKHGDHQVIDAEVVGRDTTAADGTVVAGTADQPGYRADGTADRARPEPEIAPGTDRGPVAHQEAPAVEAEDDIIPLFDEQSLEHLRGRWRDLQGEFVDDPRDAVAKADHLVAELIHELTSTYADRKDIIADRWSESPDTESLRRALRSYRAFFNQLLSPTA
ncbi:hypothetical protein [Nocardia lasii]|uniref:Uncharacterized protein n=1 Tax=Nocardia lasii TaxID=1616107 RepID=A0ABW1JMN2_9NOCA